MATKKEIENKVSAVNAENAKTVNNLSQEEAVALANKTGAQPTAEMGEAELGNMVAAKNQYNSKTSAREGMPTDDDLDADLGIVNQQQIKNATQEVGRMIGTPTYSSLTKEVEEDLNKTLLPTKRKEKEKFSAANPNDTFEGYKYDNTTYNPRGEELIGKEGLNKREQRLANRAAQKVETNQQLFEKGMEFFNQHEKYNQFGGSFNYDQFTSSMTPEVIRASSKALGVKGLSNVGIATPALYNAMKKAYEEKKGVALSQRAKLVEEKKKAEEKLLADKENAEANADKLQAIKDWRATLSNDPKKFTKSQAKELQLILKEKFGKDITVDDIMAQQTTGALIDVMLNELQIPKEYLIASGLMMPKGYEEATALDTFLDGSDEEQAAYALRFAHRRDQRNRFNQSLVDLAGITSRMIAASGGAQMEPYKNDMYDKFREDMKAARQRYDERMGEIRQREIDAEKEAYARIREREKAAQEQANLDRAFTYQQTQDRIKNAIAQGNLDLAAEELRLKKDENSPYYKSMMYQTRLNFLQNYNPADWAIMERYINGEDVDISGIKPVVKESTVNYNYNGVKKGTPPESFSSEKFVNEKEEEEQGGQQ